MLRATVLLALLALAAAEQATQIDELLAVQKQLAARIELLERNCSSSKPSTVGRRLAVFGEDELETTMERIAQIINATDPALLALRETVSGLVGKFGDVSTCLDYMWLLVCGALVMFMQAGFAILECGACRSKNAGTLLMKNLLDVCIGTLIWYLFGYGLAYGLSDNPNTFVGTQQFAGAGFMETDSDGAIVGTPHFKDWFFQWAFCATAATIVSGGVAERIQIGAYVIYSVVMTGLIYPVIVYWTWSGEGFLTELGYSDFAGSGIVHLTGGIGALAGAVIVGPRSGRWGSKDSKAFDPHNMGLVVLGTFVLWFGWYGFNCGSTLAFSDVSTATQAALVAMNTTLSAAAGGLTVFLLRLRLGAYDMTGACNGILAGLVAVCAGVGDFEPGMALLVGAAGGLAQEGGHVLVEKLRIDDPLDAFAVHGCGGMIGVLLRPLLDKKGADGDMFGAHCLAILCIVAWCGGISALVFGILRVAGKLTVSEQDQTLGADKTELGQSMYHSESMVSPDTSKLAQAQLADGGAVSMDRSDESSPDKSAESMCV